MLPIITVVIFISKSQASIPFYRNTDSLLISGYASEPELNDSRIETKNEKWISIKWTSKASGSGWVQSKNIWDVYSLHSKDWGTLITRQSTPLRQLPTSKSALHGFIENKEKIKLLDRLPNGWLYVNHQRKKGYIRISEVISHFDFSKKIKYKNSWYTWMYLLPSAVELHNQRFIPIHKIDGFKNFEIIVIKNDNTPIYKRPSTDSKITTHLKYLTRARQIKVLENKWHRSQIPHHGSVWWKTSHLKKQKKPFLLKNTDLLSRKVFDMATSPIDPTKMFVSANGIFSSQNGLSWKKIELFGDMNYPIEFSKEGILYIGHYRSINHGKTFNSYIRWDHVIKEISENPKYLKLKDIKILDEKGSHLKILVDAGSNKVFSLETKNSGKTWSSSDFETPDAFEI